MILCKPDILAAIEAGELVIDPFEPELIGAASIDLRLSPHFRRLHRSDEALDVLAERDYREPAVSEYVEVPEDGSIVLDAGETILGLTVERVRFGPTMCGRLEGRSRFARLGLLIHISAGFMAPGTDNQQVLEISNMAMRPLRLHPGTAVCQLLFERMSGPARHTGRYASQTVDDFRASP